MTRDELRKELKTGVKLEDIFEFTEGQDCLIYKGKFLPGIIGDDICYISDLSLVDIPVNKSIVKSYEIDSVMDRCYTTNDFIKECNGHENIAEDLFNYVDWQTPDINDFIEGYDDKEQFFKEYRFPMDDLFVTEEMKDLLSRVADLAAQASDEVYDDDDDNGTYGILSLCDQLYEKINRYLERDSDD